MDQVLDGAGHGYVVIDVTPQRTQADSDLTSVPTSSRPDPRVVKGVLPK